MAMNPRELRKLMEQAQKMQEQLASAQEQLATEQFEGTAGGGMVKAVVTGAQEVVSVEISPEVIDPSDPEMLGDLVTAAVNAALRTAAEAAQNRLGGLAGGLDLGGMLG